MPRLQLTRLSHPALTTNFELKSSKPSEPFGGHVKIRTSSSHKPQPVQLIKVLSDTDDKVTLAIVGGDWQAISGGAAS